MYIYLEPQWPLFLKVNPSKQDQTSKQNSRAIPMLGFFLFGLAILCREISAKSRDPGRFDGMCWKGCGICWMIWMISKYFGTSFEPQLKWGLHQLVEVAKDSNETYWMIPVWPKVWTIFWNKIQKLGTWLSRIMSYVLERFFVEDVDCWVSELHILPVETNQGILAHFLRRVFGS